MNCCACDSNPTMTTRDEPSWSKKPSKAHAVKTSEPVKQSAVKQRGPVVPGWLDEEHFVDVLEENVEGFKRIQHIEAALTGSNGENYGSVMARVKLNVELKGGASKTLAYMIKTLPQDEQGATLLSSIGFFPKETAMYSKLLPDFEQMYHSVGKTVQFGPKFFEFKKNPGTEYVLLEDLSTRGFKNADRLEGLDEEHVLAVLKIVAELHAASAVRYETVGKYDTQFIESVFSEKNRKIIEMTGKQSQAVLLDCLSSKPEYAKYLKNVAKLQKQLTDLLIESSNPYLNDFNVINHGDLWSNNIMFKYNDKGELEQTILVDFQLSRYAPPVADLFYFLLSSTKLELKVACFDKYVKFYHEQFAANMRLLKYPKKIPTLRDLHMQILVCGIWGFSSATGIMAAVLMDPSEDADLSKFISDGEESVNFQRQMYENPRYMKHLDVVMEWLDLRGFLDL